MEPFRAIVTGFRGFTDCARLRAVLDAALARRLPGVVIRSGCGPGTDPLATSYAVGRGLRRRATSPILRALAAVLQRTTVIGLPRA
jgi:hypothetical protein